jgi:hypothetical protein
MNNNMENFEEMDLEIKNLLDDIENAKSTIDLFGDLVDKQLLSLV